MNQLDDVREILALQAIHLEMKGMLPALVERLFLCSFEDLVAIPDLGCEAFAVVQCCTIA
jgi:hypothetical protein